VQRLFHLAVPPGALLGIIEMLGQTGLNENTKIICEKPFGTDLASARASTPVIAKNFDESTSFASTTSSARSRSTTSWRCASPTALRADLEPPLRQLRPDRRARVDLDRNRGAFFEETGTFRDMVVTHLLQVLAFVAMEQPISSTPSRCATRSARSSTRRRRSTPPTSSAASTTGTATNRASRRTPRPRPSWRCAPTSRTPAGRACPSSCERQVHGAEPPGRHDRIQGTGHAHVPRRPHGGQRHGNELVADFADPGSIQTHFLAKQPGPQMRLAPAVMTFRYADSFQTANNLEAYEYLILEAMLGNQAFFTRSDGIERQWEIAAPVLANPPEVEIYEPGSWGPVSIDRIVAPDRWSLPR
jgi:glucose-6-phosphate 1-dehydrogenase